MRAIEKRLRLRIKELEQSLENIKSDRQKYRDWFANHLKETIRIHGESKTYNMSWLLESMSKFLQRVDYFYW